MIKKLEACPLCGKDDARLIRDFQNKYDSEESHTEVECGTCGAYAWGETEEKAIACWNNDRRGEFARNVDFLAIIPLAGCLINLMHEPSFGWTAAFFGWLSVLTGRWAARRG